MASLIINIIGFIGAFISISIIIPQLIKTLRTKKVRDISIMMLVIWLIDAFLWLTYGLLIKKLPVIIGNQIIFLVVFAEIILKIKYSKND